MYSLSAIVWYIMYYAMNMQIRDIIVDKINLKI